MQTLPASGIESSPATDAGVAVGDLLIAIEGTPVLATTLNELRQRFRVPGKRFALTVRRGDTTIELVITTRRLI